MLCYSVLHTNTSTQYIKIDMLNKLGNNSVYSSDVAYVEVGDSITWVPKDLGHNVHFVKHLLELKSYQEVNTIKNLPTHLQKGIYLYQCT